MPADTELHEQAHSLHQKFSSVPVEITVSVGKSRPRIKDLLELAENSVLPLDKPVDAPVDLYVGNRLIARGQLEEHQDGTTPGLQVRITETLALDPFES